MRRSSALQVLGTGDVYDGDTVNGVPHGRGVLTQDRSEYDGEFEHGLRHGCGTMRWTNGDSYEGQWFRGLWDGQGTLVRASRGAGTKDRTIGFRYTGGFATNALHGAGKLAFSDGTEYEGRLDHGSITGKGKLLFATGDRYVGSFSNGKANGLGQLFLAAHRSTFSGFFQGGVMVQQTCGVDNEPCEESSEATGMCCRKCRKPIVLGAQVEAPALPADDTRLGMQVGDVDGYVRVLQAPLGSRASLHDVRAGDFILQVGATRVSSTEQLAMLLAKVQFPSLTVAHVAGDGSTVEKPITIMIR
jgi:hypothetical protein